MKSNTKIFFIASCFLFFIILQSPAFAELDLENKKISGNSKNNSEIQLIFHDSTVSGHIKFENQLITLEDSILKVRQNMFLIIDKPNDVIIYGKQLGERYLIISKINSDSIQTKLRFIANLDDIIKNTSQRDLLQEMQDKNDTGKESKNMSAKELQLIEKQKGVKESLKKYEENIQRIAELQKSHGESAKSKTERYEEYKKSKSTLQIIEEPKVIPNESISEKIVPSGSKVNVLVSQYDRVTKGYSYVFQVKTFDVNKYAGSDWSKFYGTLDGVNISAQIIGPDGKVKGTFSGITKYGMYEGSVLVNDSFWQGTYKLIVNSEFGGDKTSKSLTFFVFDEGNKSTNNPPVSNAGSDQSVDENSVVTLDGTGSYDPDGDPITYSWTQISGTNVSLSSTSLASPTFTAPNVATDIDLVFRLTVSDGRLSSTDDVTIRIKDV